MRSGSLEKKTQTPAEGQNMKSPSQKAHKTGFSFGPENQNRVSKFRLGKAN
jgi:hypothetical protein